jgi:hypothetical protein
VTSGGESQSGSKESSRAWAGETQEPRLGGSYSAVSRMGVANRRRDEWRVWSRDDVVGIKRDDEEEEGNKR